MNLNRFEELAEKYITVKDSSNILYNVLPKSALNELYPTTGRLLFQYDNGTDEFQSIGLEFCQKINLQTKDGGFWLNDEIRSLYYDELEIKAKERKKSFLLDQRENYRKIRESFQKTLLADQQLLGCEFDHLNSIFENERKVRLYTLLINYIEEQISESTEHSFKDLFNDPNDLKVILGKIEGYAVRRTVDGSYKWILEEPSKSYAALLVHLECTGYLKEPIGKWGMANIYGTAINEFFGGKMLTKESAKKIVQQAGRDLAEKMLSDNRYDFPCLLPKKIKII